jgi:hypothetical protein
MYPNRPWKGIYWYVDNVFGIMGMREVLVSAVRLLEDTVDICDFLHQLGKCLDHWSEIVLLARLHNKWRV